MQGRPSPLLPPSPAARTVKPSNVSLGSPSRFRSDLPSALSRTAFHPPGGPLCQGLGCTPLRLNLYLPHHNPRPRECQGILRPQQVKNMPKAGFRPLESIFILPETVANFALFCISDRNLSYIRRNNWRQKAQLSVGSGRKPRLSDYPAV